MKIKLFAMLLWGIVLASCGKDFDYTVLREEFYDEGCNKCGLTAAISIPSKMPKDSMLLLGAALRERWPDVLLMDVRIHVPSDYPDDKNGKGWWCTYHYQKYGTQKEKVEEYIDYIGPPSKAAEDSLKNIRPKEGELLGRWYLKVSAMEKSVFLIKKDSVYFLGMHPYVDLTRRSTSEARVLRLKPLNAQNTRFEDNDNPVSVYRITKEGDLVFESSGNMIARKY